MVWKNPIDRRRFILARATGTGHIGISELAGQLNVSMETVRRDLAIMESDGVMRRTYGGAYPVPQHVMSEHPVADSHADLRLIAAAGVELLDPTRSQVVFLDEGDLMQEVATLISTARLARPSDVAAPLTVITPALSVAALCAPAPGVSVVILGGRVHHETLAAYELTAVDGRSDFSVDVALMTSPGVTVACGATAANAASAVVKTQMSSIARQRLLLVPQSAFGRTSPWKFADIGDLDVIVTDSSLLAHEAKQYAALGPRVIRV